MVRHKTGPLLVAFTASLPVLFVLASAVYGLASFSPLGSLLLVLREPGVLSPAGGPGEPFYMVFRDGTRILVVEGFSLGALWNSLLVAAFAAISATALAVAVSVLSYLYASARLVMAALLPVSMLSFPFVDAYVVKRVLSLDYGLPAFFANMHFPVVVVPRGLAGVAFYEVLAATPYAVAIVAPYMLGVPREEVEAAVQLGARGATLAKLLAVLSRPAIYVSLVFTAVLALDDVSGPLVFSDDPLARSLLSYRAYRYFVSTATGAISSQGLGYSLLMLLASTPLILAGLLLYPRLMEQIAAAGRTRPLRQGGLREAIASAVLLGPVASLRVLSVLYAFTDEWLRSPLPRLGLEPWRSLLVHPDLLRAALNSAIYAAALAGIMLAVVVYAAWSARLEEGLAAAAQRLAYTVPILLPGIVVAYGLYLAYAGTGSPLDPLRSPLPLLLLGYYARRSPLLYHAAEAATRAVPASLYEAARGLGAGTVKAYAATVMPLLLPQLAAPLLYTSLSIAGEVSLSVTIGGLGGAEGFHHTAPLMYLVASYMGFSGLKYASLCAAATLASYGLTLLLTLTVLFLYLFLARKSYG